MFYLEGRLTNVEASFSMKGIDGLNCCFLSSQEEFFHDNYLVIEGCPFFSYFVTICGIFKGFLLQFQVVANRGQDRLSLAVAREFQQAFGGWVSPTGTEITKTKS